VTRFAVRVTVVNMFYGDPYGVAVI